MSLMRILKNLTVKYLNGLEMSRKKKKVGGD